MNNHLIASLAICTALWAPASWADAGRGCHFHGKKPAAEATVSGCATQRKDALVKAGKLDASWLGLKQDKIESVDGKKGKEWRVSFRNPAATDKTRDTLYMFFTPPGNFIAANFTGQ